MTSVTRGAEVNAQGFGFRYHGSHQDAFRGLSWHLEPGRSALVVGRSGSGKSTLALALAGLLSPENDGTTSGSLSLSSDTADNRPIRVGMVLQQPDDQTILHTVGDDLVFGLENAGVPPAEMPQRITEALEMVGLEVGRDHPTSHLSGGQRQRLALAGAIAMRPELLVLDEPLQALDEEGRGQVLKAIEAVRRSFPVTMVVIDHEPSRWKTLVDQVVVLESDSASVYSVDEAPLTWSDYLATVRAGEQPRGATVLSCVDLVVGRDSALLGEHTLSVAEGDILAITGANGSGKSTLAMTLAGLLPPFGGVISHPSHPYELSSPELARVVSFVPQNPAHHHLADTVSEDLDQALSLRDEGLDPKRRQEWIERFGLEGLLERHPATLSGGEARRLALASATIAGQRVLVLDEPSQSLDQQARLQLAMLLSQLSAEAVAIVLVTHDRGLIRSLGAREYSLPALSTTEAMAEKPKVPRWLERANPLSLLGAATVVVAGLVARVDVVEGLIALSAIALLLLAGRTITARSLIRLVPVGIAAVFAAITIALYGESSGEVLWSFGVATVSEGSLELSLATVVRIAAIATPAVVLFSSIDATRLADALSQRLRLPERFVMGALAALRLVQVLGDDYRQLLRTRRSRGVADRSRLMRLPRDVFSLLVIALRRAQVLATAMEARGFGRGPRTHFRESPWSMGDWAIIGSGLAVVVLARWGSAVIAWVW